ncbi:MAG: hypothetical protein KGJ23_15815 [Euryarchaeota archaeon]|nr:hypothetical protein [Euryarchaeota archaeon]MDE1838065.1 hypothetical protein [Euryarchaeota archaeon]MDE2046504.1 hypothetical protein [Thermoplasmata archaeon]
MSLLPLNNTGVRSLRSPRAGVARALLTLAFVALLLLPVSSGRLAEAGHAPKTPAASYPDTVRIDAWWAPPAWHYNGSEPLVQVDDGPWNFGVQWNVTGGSCPSAVQWVGQGWLNYTSLPINGALSDGTQVTRGVSSSGTSYTSMPNASYQAGSLPFLWASLAGQRYLHHNYTYQAVYELGCYDGSTTYYNDSSPIEIQFRYSPRLSALVSPSSVRVGQRVYAYSNPSLGAPPYLFNWTVDRQALSNTTQSASWVPTAPGLEQVNVTLRDAGGGWANATGFVNVTALPLTANVSLSSYSVRAGTSVTATGTILGGSGLTYAWTLNGSSPLPCSGGSCAFSLTHGAIYEVNLTVNDSLGRRAWSQAPLTVTYPSSPPPPLSVGLALSGNDTHPGAPVWFNASAAGGQGPYSFSWTRNGSSCPGTSASLKFVPGGAGNYTFAVTVTDPFSQSAVKGTLLTVLANGTSAPSPLTATLTANTTTVRAGETVHLVATASGGVPPYSFLWSLNGTNGSASGASWSPLLAHPGNYTYRVWATDGQPRVAGSNAVVVRALPAGAGGGPLVVALTVNRSALHAGGSVSVAAGASGGLGPYAYAWSLNGTNSTSLGTSASISLIFAHPGNYSYVAWASDSWGEIARSPTVVVEVLPPAGPGRPQGGPAQSALSPSTLVAASLLSVSVAVTFLVLFVRRRRRASRDQREGEDAAAPIPPSAPPGYLEGVAVTPAEWDESVDHGSAYGSYSVGPEDPMELFESVQGPGPQPEGEFRAAAKSLGQDAYRPWSLKITPEGIEVEEIARSPAHPEAIDAEFTTVEEKSGAQADPSRTEPRASPQDAYALLQALSAKPRSLEAIKLLLPLEDFELFALLAGLSKAKLIARGTRAQTKETVFVLTPLGRKLGRRFLVAADREQVAKRAALPAVATPQKSSASPLTLGKGVRVQDAHRIGELRGTLDEESPFEGLRPEDVNPQLKGKKPLSKGVLQPMEMRVTQDRGPDVRDTTQGADSDARARDLMLAARRAREEKARKSKLGAGRSVKQERDDEER